MSSQYVLSLCLIPLSFRSLIQLKSSRIGTRELVYQVRMFHLCMYVAATYVKEYIRMHRNVSVVPVLRGDVPNRWLDPFARRFLAEILCNVPFCNNDPCDVLASTGRTAILRDETRRVSTTPCGFSSSFTFYFNNR